MWSYFFRAHRRPGTKGRVACRRGLRIRRTRKTRGPRPSEVTLHRALHGGRPGFPGADGRLPLRPRCGRVYGKFHSFTPAIGGQGRSTIRESQQQKMAGVYSQSKRKCGHSAARPPKAKADHPISTGQNRTNGPPQSTTTFPSLGKFI